MYEGGVAVDQQVEGDRAQAERLSTDLASLLLEDSLVEGNGEVGAAPAIANPKLTYA